VSRPSIPQNRSRLWRLAPKLAAGGVLAASIVLAVTPAFAQDAPTPESVDKGLTVLGQDVNLLWIVIGAALVVFMQAGFAFVETGFCRAKNAANVMGMNLAIFGIGVAAFFLIGYGLMFGGYSYVLPGFDFGYNMPVGGALIGSGQWVFLWKGGFALTDLTGTAQAGAVIGFFLYMVAFMDATATIPTGAMAERWKWKSFVAWGVFCAALWYPLFGAWTWGGGWLNQLGNSMKLGFGYVDFAGSGVVHAMGGVAALAGIMVLGPRIGKFGKDGKPQAIPGHHIPMAILGAMVLLFGWFGFNGASTLAATDSGIGIVVANTAIASAFGLVTAMLWITRRTGKPDPGMMANGMLAGLVAITAPCYFVDPWAAAVIGAIAGVLVIEAAFFVERRMKLDDPVGAVAVHGANGIWGVLAVGIFANGRYGQGWNLTTSSITAGKGVTGIVADWSLGIRQLAAQTIGALVICTVMFGLVYLFFRICDRFTEGGIRVSEDEEIAGLDVPEMGVPAYPDFLGRGSVLTHGSGVVVEPRESQPA
jgi:Amt family ammonium transporter